MGGGSRWTIDESPVYAAFKADPETHRVGWDGWCGHLVRDLDSMGGTKKENVVICLESPRIKEAVAEYIRIKHSEVSRESRTALRHHGVRADVHLLLRPQPACVPRVAGAETRRRSRRQIK